MSLINVLKLANKFATKIETIYQAPENIKFQAQRKMLKDLSDYFIHELRKLTGQLHGEIAALKARDFNPKMFDLLVKVYRHLLHFNKELDKENPYLTIEKFINFILERPNGPVIENLNFLAKHHLLKTNIDTKTENVIINPELKSFDELTSLAKNLKQFIIDHPLVPLPTIGSNPPPRVEESLKDIPSFFAGTEDKTRPGIPPVKKIK